MIRLAECANPMMGPLLGRPFALYDTVLDEHWVQRHWVHRHWVRPPLGPTAPGVRAFGPPVGIDVVYLVVGKLTSLLAKCRVGDQLEVWGPLGNGFSAEPVEHLIMVAGGIGQTPFLALGRQFLGGRKYGQPSAAAGNCYQCNAVLRRTSQRFDCRRR